MALRIRACLLAAIAVASVARPSAAAACLGAQSVPPPTGGQTPAPPPSPPDTPKSGRPLVIAGWSYSSLLGNAAVANILLSRGRQDEAKDRTTWRGPQVNAAFGTKGFEVGAGFGKYVLAAQFPVGYEFRAVGGQVREQSNGLAPQQRYAGGEAAVSFASFRIAGGLVAPVGSGTTSHTPVLRGSFSFVLPLLKPPAKKK